MTKDLCLNALVIVGVKILQSNPKIIAKYARSTTFKMKTIQKYYPNYYNNDRILYQMQKYTFNREFSLIAPKHADHSHTTRFLKAHNIQGIKYLLKQFKILEGKQFNLYTSLAVYNNGIPNQTLNMKLRDNSHWRQNHWKQIKQYDFFLDVDAEGDLHKSVEYTKNIIIFLNLLNCPYTLRFSGNGFHILIPETDFPKELSYEPLGHNTIYDKYRQLCLFIKDNVCPFLDDSIYDSQRQIKLPYSLALYRDQEMVCLPLSSNDLNDFNKEMFTPQRAFQTGHKEVMFNANGNTDELLKTARVRWD